MAWVGSDLKNLSNSNPHERSYTTYHKPSSFKSLSKHRLCVLHWALESLKNLFLCACAKDGV